MAKSSFEQVTNRDSGSAVLFPACLETDEIVMVQLDFCGVLNKQDALVRWE